MTALTDLVRRPEQIRSAHDDGWDSWDIREAAPHPGLHRHIDHYADYREQTGSFSARRELAATTGVLIFVFEDPLEIVGADGEAIILNAGEAFIGGAADATSISRNLGAQRGMHIHAPLATYAKVIGAPIAEIANHCVKLGEMIGSAADDLGARLCEASTSQVRYRLLDRFFAERLAVSEEGGTPDPVEWAARRFVQPDAPRPGALAAEIGWSRKHLTRRFTARFGFSPDRFRRLARFERFWNAIRAEPRESFAALAADHGYVDQAHLTREVRQFADMTPGELRQRLIPSGGGVVED